MAKGTMNRRSNGKNFSGRDSDFRKNIRKRDRFSGRRRRFNNNRGRRRNNRFNRRNRKG